MKDTNSLNMVYTDKIHLVADSMKELHQFAAKIGLKKHFFHGVKKGHPHYDLTNDDIRRVAIGRRAIVVDSKYLLFLSQAMICDHDPVGATGVLNCRKCGKTLVDY